MNFPNATVAVEINGILVGDATEWRAMTPPMASSGPREGYQISWVTEMDDHAGREIWRLVNETLRPIRPLKGLPRILLAFWPPASRSNLSRYWQRAAARARGRKRRLLEARR